jgi:riboflavin kinase/FMN adenylyltransferase
MSDESGLPPYVTDTVITVGTFDGVHRGHRDVVQRLVSRSRKLKIPSVLVTFDPHPLEVVNPAAAPLLLTTLDE